ncbi:MAG: glycosyltransferase [Bacteroidota bacterium]
MDIQFQTYSTVQSPVFSILIPTWNNLAFVKTCVESIRLHSRYKHQIILHVNNGEDGTLKWAREEKIDHSFSPENVGVCHALNAAAKLAETDYIVFFNDDMYALPGWDTAFIDEIEEIGHDRWFLSGTMIEPKETNNPCAIQGEYFGTTPFNLMEEQLLGSYTRVPFGDWCGATWPPNIVPKALWDEVGGYSEEFSPGMSSDPDFSMKLWQAGVRYFKGLEKCRVYHFMAKTTGKIQKNPGKEQFLAKWGITQGTFNRHYLRRGQAWRFRPLAEPGGLHYTFDRLRSRLRRKASPPNK